MSFKGITRRSFIRSVSALPALQSLEKKPRLSGNASPGFQSWRGAALQEWTNASQLIVLTDMTRAAPSTVFSAKLRKGHWKVIPYEMKNGYRGNLVWAGPETRAPELKLKLGVKGWYAIFAGIFSETSVWLKLSDDPAAVIRHNRLRDQYSNSQEVLFKAAELDEQTTLHISQQSSGFASPAGVTHVTLIPLTPEEIEGIKKRRKDASRRKMVATNDQFSFIYQRRPTTAEELLAELEFFRDTDFGTLILHAGWGGDKVNYPSKIGHLPGLDLDDFADVGHRYFVEAVRELAEKKINPVKVMTDGAHDLGMKVYVGVRPAGWSFFEPYPDFWETPFFRQNRQWRCEDRDGTPTTRMSWAVPEVRKHMIGLLREQVGFGADGAHIVFNRGYPVVLYEKPLREIFHKKFGEDPRNVDESDPRIVQTWSAVVATFFQELRAVLDDEQKTRGYGKRLTISVSVLGTEPDNLQYGVDIRQLVNAGLIDEVVLYPFDFGATKKGGYDFAFFRGVCKPRGVPIHASIPVHYPEIKNQIKECLSFYEAGVDGLSIWDAGVDDIYTWSGVYSRFGHPEEVRLLLETAEADTPPRTVHFFHRLGEQIRDGRFPPYWGG